MQPQARPGPGHGQLASWQRGGIGHVRSWHGRRWGAIGRSHTRLRGARGSHLVYNRLRGARGRSLTQLLACCRTWLARGVAHSGHWLLRHKSPESIAYVTARKQCTHLPVC